MKNELKYAFYMIGLGMALVAYAHATFATKDVVTTIHDDIKVIQTDIKTLIAR